jgi:hypothetical protein
MRQRLIALQLEVSELETELAQATAMLGTDTPLDHAAMPPTALKPRRVRPIRNMSTVGATLKVLREAQYPMHVDDVIEAIHSRYGLSVRKTTLVSNLSKYVRADDTFTRAGASTYGLKEFEQGSIGTETNGATPFRE